MEATKQKPIIQDFSKGLSLAVFPRKVQSNGVELTFYNVSLQRSYRKEGDTTWHYTTTLVPGDLLMASSMLERAFWKIHTLEKVQPQA